MTQRYHPVLVALHWLLAAMVLFSLAMGMLSLVNIPNGSPEKLFALRGHMIAGVAILVLMAVRLVVRLRTPLPPPAATGHAALDRLGRIVHYALYALVMLMAASGIALALQAGLPEVVFGGRGALPESFASYLPRRVHGALAGLLAALVGLHLVAALYHQLIRRDRLLSRMGLGRPRA